MLDLIREISQTLGHNKVRTTLTGIAVTWGIFMLIVLLSLARGVTNSFEHGVENGENLKMRIWSGTTSVPYRGNREGRRIYLSDRDMPLLKQRNAEAVEDVNTNISGGNGIKSPKANISSGYYKGVYPEALASSRSFKLEHGRILNAHDQQIAAKVIMLPQNYASQLFPDDKEAEIIGKRVEISGLSFQIVGIYSSEWLEQIYIPYSTAHNMTAERENLDNLTIRLHDLSSEQEGEKVEEDVRNTLAQSHNFDPNDKRAIYVTNYFTNSLKQQQALTILDTCVWALGFLTLLTGIIGVSNIMFVTVRERTHEIGVRRAIGARPTQILRQIIAESISITVIFGYIGIVLGTAATQLITHLIGENTPLRNPTVSLSIAFEVTLVLIIAGALAGLFPALKALKVKPVEALRDE